MSGGRGPDLSIAPRPVCLMAKSEPLKITGLHISITEEHAVRCSIGNLVQAYNHDESSMEIRWTVMIDDCPVNEHAKSMDTARVQLHGPNHRVVVRGQLSQRIQSLADHDA